MKSSINNNKYKYFCLFSDCVPVKGAKRSIICDLNRGSYKFIPNSFYEFIKKYEKVTTLYQIKEEFNPVDYDVLESYFNFLIENEFAFYTSEPERFSKLDVKYDYPSQITNAIVDVDEKSDHNYKRIFEELDSVGCKSVELRFFTKMSFRELNSILKFTKLSRLNSIQIVCKFNFNKETNKLIKEIGNLWDEHKRINSIVMYGAPFNKILNVNSSIFSWMTCENVSSENHCGSISHEYFTINQDLFLENRNYNTCLNKKISIDKNGDVKNCPSMSYSYGKFNEVELKEVLLDNRFKEKWKIKKDDIKICKDCEFRYICTDCRAFLQDENDLFSKPGKCSYNPYLAIWEDQ